MVGKREGFILDEEEDLMAGRWGSGDCIIYSTTIFNQHPFIRLKTLPKPPKPPKTPKTQRKNPQNSPKTTQTPPPHRDPEEALVAGGGHVLEHVTLVEDGVREGHLLEEQAIFRSAGCHVVTGAFFG